MAKGIKTGGRQKGTPNRLTGTAKETIQQIIDQELKTFPALLNQLEPKEKIDVIIKMLPYVVPKADPPKEEILLRDSHSEFVSRIMTAMNNPKVN
jgi:hypothetical protein